MRNILYMKCFEIVISGKNDMLFLRYFHCILYYFVFYQVQIGIEINDLVESFLHIITCIDFSFMCFYPDSTKCPILRQMCM